MPLSLLLTILEKEGGCVFVIVMFVQLGLSLFQASGIPCSSSLSTCHSSPKIYFWTPSVFVFHHHVLCCIVCYVISNRVLDTCGKDGNNCRLFSLLFVSVSVSIGETNRQNHKSTLMCI